MHVVRQQERRLDSHTLTVDVPDAPQVAPPSAAPAICFDVVYALPEYLGFVSDHLAFLRGRATGPLLGAWLALIGTPIFLFKKWRMPRCAFHIDAHGIERTTRAGTITRSWADVRDVRRYRHGYLVLYERGAMPIPLRCMDRKQKAAFRRLLSDALRSNHR